MSAFETRPAHVSPFDPRPSHASAFELRPSHVSAFDSRPSHVSVFNSRPLHASAFDSRPSHASAEHGRAPAQLMAEVDIDFPSVMAEPKMEPGCSTSLMRPPPASWDIKELFDNKNVKYEHAMQPQALSHHAHPPGGHVHRCPDCGKCFSKQDRLKRHMSMHAENLQRFECLECKKSFKWERSLSQHVKIHSDNNPYVCSVCRKVFSKRCHLESHLRTHVDDQKRFNCIECGKSFKWEKSLNQHCKTHSHDLFYHCAECGKSFRKEKSYNQHFKIHSADNPFCCTKCGKAFSKRSHFEGHLKIHVDDKQCFACTECDKKFKWEKSLNAHRLLHSGNIPFKCAQCGKNFTRSDSLKKHMKTHSGGGSVKQEHGAGQSKGRAHLEVPRPSASRHGVKYIHALPFELNTSEEQIKMYMQKIENAQYDVEKHAARNNEFASFKIGVPTPYFEKFMQASVWPENMYIKEWQAYQWQPPAGAFAGEPGGAAQRYKQ